MISPPSIFFQNEVVFVTPSMIPTLTPLSRGRSHASHCLSPWPSFFSGSPTSMLDGHHPRPRCRCPHLPNVYSSPHPGRRWPPRLSDATDATTVQWVRQWEIVSLKFYCIFVSTCCQCLLRSIQTGYFNDFEVVVLQIQQLFFSLISKPHATKMAYSLILSIGYTSCLMKCLIR